jgi:carboxylesterase type B
MSLVASLLLASAVVAQSWTVGQAVNTISGKIKGQASSWKPQVSEYLGVPFAQPPVGSLRFAPPKLFTGSGVINATKFGASCPQNVAGAAVAKDKYDSFD